RASFAIPGRHHPPPARSPSRRSPAIRRDSPSPSRKSPSIRPPLPLDPTLVPSWHSSLGLLWCEDPVCLHREVLRQPEPVGPRRRLEIARFRSEERRVGKECT